MNSNYKLVGFLNMFNVIPDFVYPVFKCDEDKNLYFQSEYDKDNLKIECFVQVKEDALKLITYLENIKHNVNDTQRKITINSEITFGFQVSENEVKFGNYEYFKNFFDTFNSQNQVLTNQISAFLKEYSK